MEYTVDAFIVVLRDLVGTGVLIHEAQLCGLELLEIIFSLHTHKCCSEAESMFEMSRRLLVVQRELGLSLPELSSVILSLFVCLIQSELEHVQLSMLKLLLFLLKWKSENESVGGLCELNQELLFVFLSSTLWHPLLNPLKEAATELLIILGKALFEFIDCTKK